MTTWIDRLKRLVLGYPRERSLRKQRFQQLVERDEPEEIEAARSWVEREDVPSLITLYWLQESWSRKRAVVELLQDQFQPGMGEMMLDFLRAPVAAGDERTELAKAIALGFVDERYDRFTAYINDRKLLARDVEAVLRERGLEPERLPRPEKELPPPAPPPVDRTQPPNQRLLEGATRGDLAAVRQALADGADIDAAIEGGDYDGCSALIMALMRRRFDVASFLIDQGADVNHRRPARHTPDRTRGQTPLWWAASHGHVPLARTLIARGADVNTPDHHGGTPLTTAASSGHLEMVRFLVEMGADVDAQIYDGRTALNLAVTKGRTAVARYLLGLEKDPNRKGTSGHTPLMVAAENNNYDLAQLLIEQGADVNAVHPGPGSYAALRGWTPLVFAVRAGSVRITRLLIEAGADVNHQVPPARNARGELVPVRSVIDFARGKRAEAIIELLREAGAG